MHLMKKKKHAINFNLNDFIIVENDDAEMCYKAKKNEKNYNMMNMKLLIMRRKRIMKVKRK